MDNDKARVAHAQAVKQITENWVAHAEGIALAAKLVRTKYLALLREGFSEADAINLCTRI